MSALAEGLQLKELGTPFQRADLDVRWKAPTNGIPDSLWVYRARPNVFSRETISNVMSLGPFAEINRTNKFLHLSDDNTRVRFALPNGRSLEISPRIGGIEYEDTAAQQMEISEGVPAESEILKLTSAYLPILGIDISSLAHKPNSSDLLVYFTVRRAVLYDTKNKPYVTNVYSRGVYYIRRVDGIDFAGLGRGGCRIDIGNHGKCAKISVSWRNLERGRCLKTANPETIIQWIRAGKSVLAPMRDDIDPFNWSTVRSLTITNATPYYFGEKSLQTQDEIWPFVTLRGTVDTGQGNTAVEIECPITDNKKS